MVVLYDAIGTINGDCSDAWTFTSVLKACGEVMDICHGRQIHGIVVKQGLFTNVFVVNSLMAMYTKCSRLLSIFRDMRMAANVLVVMYSRCGKMAEATRLFHYIEVKDSCVNLPCVVDFLQHNTLSSPFSFCHGY